jgi:hypothetical protein
MTEADEHLCPTLERRTHYPFYRVRCLRQQGAWYLCHESFAGEQDVIAGEADHVGEVISSLQLLIQFCPFCGIRL